MVKRSAVSFRNHRNNPRAIIPSAAFQVPTAQPTGPRINRPREHRRFGFLCVFASLREPSQPQRTDSEVHVTLFPARSWYVPRTLGAGGVYEMTDVVDAIKVIAIVIGTAAHTLRCYCRGELLAVQARRAGTSKGRLN